MSGTKSERSWSWGVENQEMGILRRKEEKEGFFV
jgi:hypothetical protein